MKRNQANLIFVEPPFVAVFLRLNFWDCCSICPNIRIIVFWVLKMMNVKRILCDSDLPLGKFTEWAATAIKTTVVEIDVSDMDMLEIACPCCMFWRGVLMGAVVFGVIGLLIGVCL